MPDHLQSAHREMQLRHLEQAKRHVIQGERGIAESAGTRLGGKRGLIIGQGAPATQVRVLDLVKGN